MARTDWIALVTEPANEYLASSELERFGLTPYLPQCQRRCRHPNLSRLQSRCYPLFPRYLLLPVKQIDHDLFRAARGLHKVRPVLGDTAGTPWRAPEKVILALKEAETAGNFNDTLEKGDKIRVSDGILSQITGFIEVSSANMVHILVPLLGGATLKVARARVERAGEEFHPLPNH